MPQPFTIMRALRPDDERGTARPYGYLDPNPLTTGSGSNFVLGDW